MRLLTAFVFAVTSGICSYYVPQQEILYEMPKVYQEKKNAPSNDRTDIWSVSQANGNILNGSNDFLQFYVLEARGQNDSGLVEYTVELHKSIELAIDGTILSPQMDLTFGFSAYSEEIDYSLEFFSDIDTFSLGGTVNTNSVNTGRLDMSNFYFDFYSFFYVTYEIDGRALDLDTNYFGNNYVTLNLNSNSVNSLQYYYNFDGSVSVFAEHDTLLQDFYYLLGILYPNVTEQDILSVIFDSQVFCAFRAVWGAEGIYNYDLGYSQGFTNGENRGYQSGYQVGYDKAKEIYQEDTTFGNMFFSLLDTPFKVLRDTFNIEFFGINLSSLIVTLMSIALVYFAIKWF